MNHHTADCYSKRVIESFSKLLCDYLANAVQCKGLSFDIVQPDDA